MSVEEMMEGLKAQICGLTAALSATQDAETLKASRDEWQARAQRAEARITALRVALETHGPVSEEIQEIIGRATKDENRQPRPLTGKDAANRRTQIFADRIRDARDVAFRFGGIGGEHHKQWVIDQMLRAMLGLETGYLKFRTEYDGDPEESSWSEGTAP